MREPLVCKYGEKLYSGCKPFKQNDAILHTDRVVIAWFDNNPYVWIVESESGIGEVRRFYRQEFGKIVPTIVLLQSQNPMWIVSHEHFVDDDTQSFATGPFFDVKDAETFLNIKRLEEDFVGGETCPLLKP